MRSVVFVVSIIIMLGCSHVQTVTGVQTVTLSELNAVPDTMAQKMKNDEAVVLHIKKGERIPVTVSANLPFATLQSGENVLVTTEDIYLYVSPRGMLISRDGKRFAPLQDVKGLKEIYGFEKGSFSVGFRASKLTPPALTVGVATQ